jgi:ribokinase
MGIVWVIGAPAWDRVIRLDAYPVRGGFARGRLAAERPGGGAANVARALASAGHRVLLVGRVGDDERGRALRTELAGWGVDVSGLAVGPAPTAESFVWLDPEGESTVVSLEPSPVEADPDAFPHGPPPDAVFAAWFGPGVRRELARLRDAGVRVAVPWPPPGTPPVAAELLFVSEPLLPGAARADPVPAARAATGGAVRWVVVSRGPRGAAAYGADGTTVEVSPANVPVVDATGAGDALAAGVLHGLLCGWDMARALGLGARWGARAVGLARSVPPRWDELGA